MKQFPHVPIDVVASANESTRILEFEYSFNGLLSVFTRNKIVFTLHDLDLFLCREFGVPNFELLGFGKLSRHPQVSQMFKISKQTQSISEISAEQVFEGYYQYVRGQIQSVQYDNAQLSQRLKQKSRFTSDKFLAYLSDLWDCKSKCMGVVIADWNALHEMISQNVAQDLVHTNKFLLKMEKKQKEIFDETVQAFEKKSQSWTQLLHELSGNDQLNFTKLAKFNLVCAEIAHEWTLSCANKPFYIGGFFNLLI